MEDNQNDDISNILDGSEVRAGMYGIVIALQSDGTYDKSTMKVDDVIHGETMTDIEFNSLRNLAEAQRDDYFLNFSKEDLKNEYIIVSYDMIFIYDASYYQSKSGIYFRFVVPAKERWKASKKLANTNKNTGIFEMRYLKSFDKYGIWPK